MTAWTDKTWTNPSGPSSSGGLVRIPLSLAWFDDWLDNGGTCTGPLTDDGAGRITIPGDVPGSQGTLKLNSKIGTAPLTTIAAALGVTVSEIVDGSVPIEAVFSNLVSQPRISIGVGFCNGPAADQATMHGLAVGIGRASPTADSFSATCCKSNTSGGTTAIVNPNSWSQWLIRVIDVGGTPNYEASGTLWYPDGNGKPRALANTVYKEASASVVPTHFCICAFQEGSGGTAGDTSVDISLVAKTNPDSTGQP